MRGRKLLWMSAVVLALVAVGAITRPPADRVTKENYDRIRGDTGLAEVESLLGPPGDYRTGPGETEPPMRGSFLMSTLWTWIPDADDGRTSAGIMPVSVRDGPAGHKVIYAAWVGDEGQVHLTIVSDFVLFQSFDARRKVERGPLDHIRWQLGRYWRKWFPK